MFEMDEISDSLLKYDHPVVVTTTTETKPAKVSLPNKVMGAQMGEIYVPE